ncbi:MAG: P1 family peptidase [Solobacterium sp.]|nr:P1 family peptidase [Solobacterium sp.]
MTQPWNEIDITEIEGFRIGNAEYREAGTGCTVILADPPAVTSLDVRGGAPASREAALLDPLAANDAVNAVLLSGGSAFGLNAASGVVRYLEEQGQGFPTDYGPVPIVCASCLFDLPVGDSSIRPDEQLGYQACLNAGNFSQGNVGAGTGASCGKLAGAEHAMKSGLGAYAIQVGPLKVGAVVAANPLGNIVQWKDGTVIAGCHDETGFLDEEELFASMALQSINAFQKNTTIGVILTNAKLDKTLACKTAAMAHDGYARAIRPVHTMFDGDSIYTMCSGHVPCDVNAVGVLAARVMAEAIANAALTAESAYGLRGCKESGQ